MRSFCILLIATLIAFASSQNDTESCSGIQCLINANECDSDPCLNGGNCTDEFLIFKCSCAPGFTGRQCQDEINECLSNPCLNGTCEDRVNGYTCTCHVGYTGTNCDQNIDDCSFSPCLNDATCVDRIDDYYCQCPLQYEGRHCDFNSTCPINESVCDNNAFCTLDPSDNPSCRCLTGYTGEYCETELNECDSNPCNNGSCIDKIGGFSCSCFTGYTGPQCNEIVDLCEVDAPCLNDAICIPHLNGYNCFCRQGFTGKNCHIDINECLLFECQNGGSCTDGINSINCSCADGFYGDFCENPITPCKSMPCKNGGTCNDNGTEYTCACPPQFTGNDCESEFDICSSNPCKNQSTCVQQNDSYICQCLPGFDGMECDQNIDDCMSDPCLNNATCTDEIDAYTCTCMPGYTGDNCSIDIDDCMSLPCPPSATCLDQVNDYICLCPLGLTGKMCETDLIDCSDEPCNNGSTCVDINSGVYSCICPPGFTGDHCLVDIDECQLIDCLNNGTCIDGLDQYTCVCPPGYSGINCEYDPCDLSLCSNSSTCVVVNDSYSCLCPVDYTDVDCSIEIDDCQSNPCHNNGTCSDLVGTYACTCPSGFTGNTCEDEINECLPNPCVNGTCSDLINNFSCDCFPGFSGQRCEFDIDECINVTCLNNGICLNLVNAFECACPNGFIGKFCQNETNECAPISPCANGGTCIDQVADYTCECLTGFTGRNCTIDIDLCDPHHCFNNGTCSQNLTEQYFNCTCMDGFTGQLCQTDIDECISNPCLNGGNCVNTVGSYYCNCTKPYFGTFCNTTFSQNCFDLPCLNNGTCVTADDDVGSGLQYSCLCTQGFTGDRCETSTLSDDCADNPCLNGGTCIVEDSSGSGLYGESLLMPDSNQYSCICAAGYTGTNCSIEITPCYFAPCQNNGVCIANDDTYSCDCPIGFVGQNCSEDITSDILSFHGDSFIVMPNLLSNISSPATTLIQLSFLSQTENALLLYASNNTNNTYMYLSIESGILTLHLFQESIVISLKAQYHPVSDDKWHTVTIIKNYSNLILQVDGYNNSTQLLGSGLTLDSSIYVGGHVNISSLSDEARNLNGLSGLMNISMVIDEKFVHLVNDAINGYRIGESIGTICRPDICTNGGICEEDGMQYICHCPLGFQGTNCESDINIRVPSFTNGSYLVIDGYTIGTPISFEIDVTIHTTSSDGLIFLIYDASNMTTNYLSLVLEDSSISVLYDFGTGSNRQRYNGSSISDDNWHILTVKYNNSMLHLMIDDIIAWSSNISIAHVALNSPVFIGGYPTGLSVPINYRPAKDFTGCVRELQVNNNSLDLIDNSQYGLNINECPQPICSFEQCFNGGTCEEDMSISSDGFACICDHGYSGKRCEVPLPFCSPNPCMFDGQCQEYENRTFTCTCSLGQHGRFCELQIDIPAFYGYSYLKYQPLRNVMSSVIITMTIMPHSANGVLLFNPFSNTQFPDYISIALVNSHVVYRYNLGFNPGAELISSQSLTLNQWHTITVNLTGRVGFLKVDGQPLVSGSSPGDHTNLNVAGDMWLGGHTQFSIVSQFIGVSTGFTGCISSLSINGILLDMIHEAKSGYGVGQCNITTSCNISNPCLHGATCVDNGSSFTCICTPGFTGPLCGSDIFYCLSNPCANGGTCQEVGSTFNCLCPLGYTGTLCNESIGVTIPSFSHVSYIRYIQPTTITSSTTIKLTFYPKSLTGMLLYIGGIHDFLSLSLYNGRVEFRFDLGSGHSMITSGEVVTLNEWNTITATRAYKLGTLLLGNSSSDSGSSPGTSTFLDATGDIYIGGADDFSKVSNDAGTKIGFDGCINVNDIKINNVNLGSAIESRSISQCTVDACNPNPCLNNGACIHSGIGYTCGCKIGYTGYNCNQSINLTIPFFNGNSYLSYPKIVNSFSMTNEVSIELYANSTNGLILFNSQSAGKPDYISLSLVDGSLQFSYNLGSGPAVIISDKSISLNVWHSITLSRTGSHGTMVINNEPPVTGSSQGIDDSLELENPFYLGGVPDYSQLPSWLGVNMGFVGCVRLLNVSQTNIVNDLIGSAIDGVNVNQCMLCSLNYCLNEGQCVMNGINGSESCRCSLPFAGGERCTERVSFESAYFSGNSYFRLPITGVPIDRLTVHTVIKLSFSISANASGLLFYIGMDNPSLGNYIMLGISNNGYFEYRYELGSGEVNITSAQPIEIGSVYNITVLRTDHKGRIILSNQGIVNGEGYVMCQQLNLSPFFTVLYLGGAPDVPSISQQVYQRGFVGRVINAVSIGYHTNLQTIDLTAALKGHNVTY